MKIEIKFNKYDSLEKYNFCAGLEGAVFEFQIYPLYLDRLRYGFDPAALLKTKCTIYTLSGESFTIGYRPTDSMKLWKEFMVDTVYRCKGLRKKIYDRPDLDFATFMLDLDQVIREALVKRSHPDYENPPLYKLVSKELDIGSKSLHVILSIKGHYLLFAEILFNGEDCRINFRLEGSREELVKSFYVYGLTPQESLDRGYKALRDGLCKTALGYEKMEAKEDAVKILDYLKELALNVWGKRETFSWTEGSFTFTANWKEEEVEETLTTFIYPKEFLGSYLLYRLHPIFSVRNDDGSILMHFDTSKIFSWADVLGKTLNPITFSSYNRFLGELEKELSRLYENKLLPEGTSQVLKDLKATEAQVDVVVKDFNNRH